jgi:hypothetical protein
MIFRENTIGMNSSLCLTGTKLECPLNKSLLCHPNWICPAVFVISNEYP